MKIANSEQLIGERIRVSVQIIKSPERKVIKGKSFTVYEANLDKVYALCLNAIKKEVKA